MLELLVSEECPLLQVCVYLDGSNAENKISLLVILCIIMYVKKKNLNRYFFFYKTDYGKMLKYREKYREKYRSTDISVDLYLWLSKCEKHHQNSPSAIVHLIWLLWSCSYFSGPWQCYLLASQWDSHKPPSFHPKYLKLCSEDEQSFYGFGMT